jgi:hypothetical protein
MSLQNLRHHKNKIIRVLRILLLFIDRRRTKYITKVSPSHARGISKAVLSGYAKNTNYFLPLLGYGVGSGGIRKYKLNIWRKYERKKKKGDKNTKAMENNRG